MAIIGREAGTTELIRSVRPSPSTSAAVNARLAPAPNTPEDGPSFFTMFDPVMTSRRRSPLRSAATGVATSSRGHSTTRPTARACVRETIFSGPEPLSRMSAAPLPNMSATPTTRPSGSVTMDSTNVPSARPNRIEVCRVGDELAKTTSRFPSPSRSPAQLP